MFVDSSPDPVWLVLIIGTFADENYGEAGGLFEEPPPVAEVPTELPEQTKSGQYLSAAVAQQTVHA